MTVADDAVRVQTEVLVNEGVPVFPVLWAVLTQKRLLGGILAILRVENGFACVNVWQKAIAVLLIETFFEQRPVERAKQRRCLVRIILLAD